MTGEELYKVFDRADRVNLMILRAAGFSPLVRELTQSVGHPSLEKTLNELTKLERGEEPDWLMLILHWADDVVKDDKPIGLARIHDLAKGVGINAVYKMMNEYGREIWDGQTLYEKQYEVGERVENALRTRLVQKGVEIPKNTSLTDFVWSEINKDIESVQLS